MEEIMKVDADLTSVDYETFFAVATRNAFGAGRYECGPV
jgi:hypothetical protein